MAPKKVIERKSVQKGKVTAKPAAKTVVKRRVINTPSKLPVQKKVTLSKAVDSKPQEKAVTESIVIQKKAKLSTPTRIQTAEGWKRMMMRNRK